MDALPRLAILKGASELSSRVFDEVVDAYSFTREWRPYRSPATFDPTSGLTASGQGTPPVS